MAFTHTESLTYRTDGRTIASGVTHSETADGEEGFEGVVADTTIGGDVQVTIAFTVAKLKSLVLFSTKNITVYSNADHLGAFDDQIVVTAGVPIVWHLARLEDCPFVGDASLHKVTKLYVRNNTALDASVKLSFLVDDTP